MPNEFEKTAYADPVLTALAARLVEGRQLLVKAIAFTKQKGGMYMDLYGRKLVDSAIAIIIGHLFVGQAELDAHKKAVARRFIDTRLPDLQRDVSLILSGDTSAMDQYEVLSGPLPPA